MLWSRRVCSSAVTGGLARSLAKHRTPCSVITSSLVIAGQLWGCESIELMLLGGRVRRGSPDLVGPGVELMLEKLTGDIAFLGADAIDPERGCFAADIDTARVAERMAASARRVVVVADSSKLGQAGPARFLRVREMDELITDRAVPPSVVTALRGKGVKVTPV
jgi:DeoR/GlpR family transcriptional regulator of sugar metabolism